MKFGIITLVTNNYGNKFQNYAVENLLKKYGEVQTYCLEDLYLPPKKSGNKFNKVSFNHINTVIRARLMYQYGLNDTSHNLLYSLLFVLKNKVVIKKAMNIRENKFRDFSNQYLHIAEDKLNFHNAFEKKWIDMHDYFICGSDQIWNPFCTTTSKLAFCNFAPEKTICLSPSFGVTHLPEYRKDEYAKWLKKIYKLSVREDAGKKIIKELTGRDAEVFLDPTMLISIEEWVKLCRKPENNLPEKYIVCYFLGKIDRNYRKKIETFAKEKNLPIIKLLDITAPEYYSYDPAEVLYIIMHSKYVLTDSFHGTVFSILFHKQFYVFERTEGGASMNSRLETLIEKFGLEDCIHAMEKIHNISEEHWNRVDEILNVERKKTFLYIQKSIDNE